jgi:hypothetical protein
MERLPIDPKKYKDSAGEQIREGYYNEGVNCWFLYEHPSKIGKGWFGRGWAGGWMTSFSPERTRSFRPLNTEELGEVEKALIEREKDINQFLEGAYEKAQIVCSQDAQS